MVEQGEGTQLLAVRIPPLPRQNQPATLDPLEIKAGEVGSGTRCMLELEALDDPGICGR